VMRTRELQRWRKWCLTGVDEPIDLSLTVDESAQKDPASWRGCRLVCRGEEWMAVSFESRSMGVAFVTALTTSFPLPGSWKVSATNDLARSLSLEQAEEIHGRWMALVSSFHHPFHLCRSYLNQWCDRSSWRKRSAVVGGSGDHVQLPQEQKQVFVLACRLFQVTEQSTLDSTPQNLEDSWTVWTQHLMPVGSPL
jgi:hypothetical protein